MRYELTDFEWAAIRSFLSNKPCGISRSGADAPRLHPRLRPAAAIAAPRERGRACTISRLDPGPTVQVSCRALPPYTPPAVEIDIPSLRRAFTWKGFFQAVQQRKPERQTRCISAPLACPMQ
jgi:hypothetical protein